MRPLEGDMERPTTVLVTGAAGRLGQELVKVLPNSLSPGHREAREQDSLGGGLDVTDLENVKEYIATYRPGVVVHLAALASLPVCEANKELAWQTNVMGTQYLVQACEEFVPSCYFLYMSTPCVFSGREGNYDEEALPYPENFYGLTKLVGEVVVQRSRLQWCIARANFIPFDRYPYPRAFVDRWGTYLFAHQTAKAMREVVEMRTTGVVHLAGNKKMSLFDLALRCPNSGGVLPMTYEEYYKENPGAPRLTKDMSLITRRWHRTYDIEAE